MTNSHPTIWNAKNLSELCDSLNALRDEIISRDDRHSRLEDEIDLTSLPTFGSNPPRDTAEIWSFDDENLLISRNDGGFELMAR